MKMLVIVCLGVVLGLSARAVDTVGEITFEAQPKFKSDTSGFTKVVLVHNKDECEIYWSWVSPLDGEVTRYLPVKLRSSEHYVFTLEETRSPAHDLPAGLDPEPFVSKSHELVRIVQNGKVLYDRETCEIHHCKMTRKEFEVRYGFGRGSDPEAGLKALFPHYDEHVYGGCDAGPDAPKSKRIYVCEECKAAKAKWEASAKK